MNKVRLTFCAILLAAIMVSAAAVIPCVRGQGGVVGIINVPPSFDTILVDTTDESRFLIDLELTDMNGDDRIYLVNITILGAGDVLAKFSYHQYDAPGNISAAMKLTDQAEIFRNDYGSFLVVDECEVSSVPLSWTTDMMDLRVIFRFLPLEADTISITCIDMGNLSATYIGPFPGNPGFLFESSILPLSVSLLAALVGAAFIAVFRHKSNKMAKIVEKAIARR